MSYDLHVEISDGSSWYGWENQTNIGTNCFGPATCSYIVTWAKVDYHLNTTIDNITHTVTQPSTSYTYTSYPFGFAFTGTVKFNDLDNLGTEHTKTNISGTTTTAPCINCPAIPTSTPFPTPTPITCPAGSSDPYNTCVSNTCTTIRGSCGTSNCTLGVPCGPTPTPTTIPPTYRISGTVYIDNNENGTQDPEDPGYNNGAAVTRIGPAPATTTVPTTTNISGFYSFSNLISGRYTITLTVPPGYRKTTIDPPPILVPPDNQTVNFGIALVYTISGNVFIDDGAGTTCPGPACVAKDGIMNGAEENYILGASTVQVRSESCAGTLIGSSSPGNGAFSVSNIPAGTYAVCYTSLPGGYQIIYPTITPPSYIVTVGSSCSTDTAHGSSCSSGSIINLNFAILLYGPWIQSTGTDIRLDTGFNYYIPPLASCGPYASGNGGGVSNGIIFTGGTNANFGAGSAGQTTNWVVGGGSYPELFIPSK
ncbi:MAG: SdrD B-like domain-containing protein, partial [Nanoarchaeota archaeon]